MFRSNEIWLLTIQHLSLFAIDFVVDQQAPMRAKA